MKHLPKHLQPRWRYLAVTLSAKPGERIDRRSFQRELWYAARGLLGDPGSAAADLTVVDFAFEDGQGTALIRARRDEVTNARAALACVHTIDGARIGLAVVRTSGTMRAAREGFVSSNVSE